MSVGYWDVFAITLAVIVGHMPEQTVPIIYS
jgi:hypothetical protein